MTSTASELLKRIGGRVRRRRTDLGLTIQRLATSSGVSARFLSDVETGRANISISRLSDLASALELPLTSMVALGSGGPRQAIDQLLSSCTDEQLESVRGLVEVVLGHRTPPIIGLLGIRGPGKSAVGPLVAAGLSLPFVEPVATIETRAGMPVADIFTIHGEPYYRAVELECLKAIVSTGQRCVVALPGGIVGYEAASKLLQTSSTSVWLRATAEDCWARVFLQGDTRPMEGRDDAMADLRTLVERRAALYARADFIVDTTATTPNQVAATIIEAIEAASLRP